MCQVMEKWEITKKAAPTLLSTEYETDGNYPTYTAFYEIDYLDKESVPKLSFLANPTTRVSVFDFDQLSPGPYFHEKRRMLLFGTYDVEAKMVGSLPIQILIDFVAESGLSYEQVIDKLMQYEIDFEAQENHLDL